jgi:carbamoyltransferase
MKNVLGIHGSHDASFTFIDKNDKLRVIEVERLVKKRYAAFSVEHDITKRSFSIDDDERGYVLEYVSSLMSDPNEIDTIVYGDLNALDQERISEFFPNAKFEHFPHHEAHAYCAHYQSGFDKSIILSVDGGGTRQWLKPELQSENCMRQVTFTQKFLGDEKHITELGNYNIDFGTIYSKIGWVCSDLKKREDDDLTWAGKIMGLCGYGNVKEEWISAMNDTYLNSSKITLDPKNPETIRLHHLSALNEVVRPDEKFNLDCLSGQDAWDLAATSQFVFSSMLFSWIYSEVKRYPDRDVVMTGGCALNVLFNQALSEFLHARGKKLYVPPNPNDCGLSLGYFLSKTDGKYRGDDFVYDGVELLDKDKLDEYVKERNAKKVEISEVVDLLKEGMIIGVINGDSEIGPRALGNRSIICDPSYKNMKDTLNAKVKFREWYRPFAPVCLLEDSFKFFHDVYESKYMSLAPMVREEFRDSLSAITHVDGTSRLQTVCEETGHEFFREVLLELRQRGEIPVILNTSFNIRGKPILTTIEDALYVLDNTELDYVLVEGYLFKNDKIS